MPPASIWNGSHGPTPPVIRADAKNATAPRTKPNPRPKTRAARMRRNHSGSNPLMPGLGTRSAAKQAARIPSNATALASIAPSESSAITMASRSGMRPTKIQGASPLWAEFWPAARWINSGQAKAATPNTVVRKRRKEERVPNRIAGGRRRPGRGVGRGTETVMPAPLLRGRRGLRPPSAIPRAPAPWPPEGRRSGSGRPPAGPGRR